MTTSLMLLIQSTFDMIVSFSIFKNLIFFAVTHIECPVKSLFCLHFHSIFDFSYNFSRFLTFLRFNLIFSHFKEYFLVLLKGFWVVHKGFNPLIFVCRFSMSISCSQSLSSHNLTNKSFDKKFLDFFIK